MDGTTDPAPDTSHDATGHDETRHDTDDTPVDGTPATATPATTTVWNYRPVLVDEVLVGDRDIAGFDVEALDGSIGSIASASAEADNSHIVVDTGFWIFGKQRLIPAGAVTAIDVANRKVVVALTKDQIKAAPDFEPERGDDPNDAIHRSNYNEYYGPHGW